MDAPKTLFSGIPIMSRKEFALTLPLLSAAILASGCGVRTQTTELNPNLVRSPTCDEAVDTYTSRAQVSNDYYEVAWISAEGNSVYTSDGKIMAQVRKKAAEFGSNPISVNEFIDADSTCT